MIQVSVVRMRGYGPWTLTLGSDREHELQAHQADTYSRLQRLLSERGALAFPARADEVFAVTNGMDSAAHAGVLAGAGRGAGLEALVGSGATPLEAERAAHEAGRGPGGAVRGEAGGGDSACIMHLDVDGLSARRESSTPYGIAREILGLHHLMAGHFAGLGSMSFFMGGDNFMVVASGEARAAAQGFLDLALARTGMRLNCGIGTGPTAREAARLATESLDTIRRLRGSGERRGVYELPC